MLKVADSTIEIYARVGEILCFEELNVAFCFCDYSHEFWKIGPKIDQVSLSLALDVYEVVWHHPFDESRCNL